MSELLAVAPLLLLGAAAGLVLLERSIRSTLVGVVLVAVSNLAEIVFDRSFDVGLGAIQVSGYDLVFAILAAATAARALRADRLDPLRLALAGVAVIALIALARGVGEHGLETAVNEFRKTFYFLTGALYVSSATPTKHLFDRLGRLWLVVSIVVVAVVLLRWASIATGLPLGPLALGERALQRALLVDGSLRVVHADDTLLLLQGFLLAVAAWRRERSAWMGRLAIGLLAVVFLLQHRTIWVTTVVAVGLVLVRDRELGRRLTLLIAGAVAVVGVLVFLLLDSGQSDVGQQLAGSVRNSNTFEWRFQGWQQLLTDRDTASPANTLLGRPFGTGWERFLDGQIVVVAPHNYYVEAWLRLGLLGTVALLGVLAGAGTRLWRATGGDGLLGPNVLLLLLVTQLTFFLTYDPAPLQGVVTGLVVAGAGAVARRPLPRPAELRSPAAVARPA